MRNRAVQILFYIVITITAAALQDMSPCIFGIKPPIMLSVALAFSLHEAEVLSIVSRTSKSLGIAWMFYAFIIGFTSDALGSLPTGCDAGFFLVSCIALRLVSGYVGEMSRFSLSLISLVVLVPLHETWMSAWGVSGIATDVPFHSLLTLIPSLLTGTIVFAVMPVLEKLAAVDKDSQEVLV